MSWSSALLAELAAPTRREEVWLLELVAAYEEPGRGSALISSAPGYGEDAVMIAEGGPTFTGSRLSPGSWSSTVGTFTLPLAGDIRPLLQRVTRGTTVRLRLGFEGWHASDFETMGWGQVSQIRGSGASWTLEVRDPIASISNRLDTTNPQLFEGNGSTTTVTSDPGGATITVGSTAGFAMDSGGAGVGLIRINSELITYTGTTATTFTGCTRGVLGTTGTTHAASDTVTELVLLRGHPLDIVRRLLVSRGVTGNSAWDDYPEAWGLGLLQTLVDLEDIDRWATKAVKVSSGSYQWDVMVEGTWSDPGSQLASLLANAGLFFTTRQGLLTCRAATWPANYTEPAWLAEEWLLTDEDIVDGWDSIAQEIWASELPTEYAGITVATATGSPATTSDTIQTLPAAPTQDYDVSDRVWTNESPVRDEMANRLALLAERIPEGLLLTCAGLRMAALAPGDCIPVRSERLVSRYTHGYTASSYGRVCLVTQVSPDFASNTVQLRLLAFPGTNGEFE